MSDERLEQDLRAWLAEHTEADVPVSLRQFLAGLPTAQSAVERVRRRSATTGPARRRDLTVVFLAAVLLLALGGGLIVGIGLVKTVAPSRAPSSTSPGSIAPTAQTSPSTSVPTPAPPPETLRSTGFANDSVGWALTTRRLRLTFDGGLTWRTAGPPIDYGTAPKGASFFDATHGWVVSEDSFSSSLDLWRTADSGDTWVKSVLPAVPMAPETVGDATTDWIDADHAVIDVEGGMPNGYLDGLLVTADGGATWSAPAMQSATAGADGITGVSGFLTPSAGWLAGGASGSRLWMTRDGGQSWTLQQLAVPTGYLDDQGDFWGAPHFFTAIDGVVARTFANNTSTVFEIYQTSDGGLTWQPLTGPVGDPSSWSFPSLRSWIVWSGSTAWRSTDQGASWTSGVASGLSEGDAPVMIDALHGWSLTGNSDELLITADGGRTWTAVDPLAAAPAGPPTAPPSTQLPTLLTLSGNDAQTSAEFTASGDVADLAYTFNCTARGSAGHFAVLFLDRSGVRLDEVNYTQATSGADTSTVYLSNTASPYHLAIDSDCAWSATVTGTP